MNENIRDQDQEHKKEQIDEFLRPFKMTKMTNDEATKVVEHIWEDAFKKILLNWKTTNHWEYMGSQDDITKFLWMIIMLLCPGGQ